MLVALGNIEYCAATGHKEPPVRMSIIYHPIVRLRGSSGEILVAI